MTEAGDSVVGARLGARGVEVRPAVSLHELSDAIDLAVRTFPGLHERTDRDAQYYAARRADEGDLHVVALTEGRVVGLALGSLSPAGDAVTVGEVAVETGHRHRGVGRALLGELEARAMARGIARMALGADEDVAGFYISCGWAPTIQITVSGTERRAVLERLRAGVLRGHEVGDGQEHGGDAMRVWVRVDGYDPALAERLSAIDNCSAFVMFCKALPGPESAATA